MVTKGHAHPLPLVASQRLFAMVISVVAHPLQMIAFPTELAKDSRTAPHNLVDVLLASHRGPCGSSKSVESIPSGNTRIVLRTQSLQLGQRNFVFSTPTSGTLKSFGSVTLNKQENEPQKNLQHKTINNKKGAGLAEVGKI